MSMHEVARSVECQVDAKRKLPPAAAFQEEGWYDDDGSQPSGPLQLAEARA